MKTPMQQNGMTGALSVTLPDQLAKLGLKPGDIDIVGISHMHGDQPVRRRTSPTRSW